MLYVISSDDYIYVNPILEVCFTLSALTTGSKHELSSCCCFFFVSDFNHFGLMPSWNTINLMDNESDVVHSSVWIKSKAFLGKTMSKWAQRRFKEQLDLKMTNRRDEKSLSGL